MDSDKFRKKSVKIGNNIQKVACEPENAGYIPLVVVINDDR